MDAAIEWDLLDHGLVVTPNLVTRHGDGCGELYGLGLRRSYLLVEEIFIGEDGVDGRERLIFDWIVKVHISFSSAKNAETHACTSE